MCQEISKISYTKCTHQVTFWEGEARFCLTGGNGTDLHFVNSFVPFLALDEKCPRCVVAQQIRAEGKKIPRGELANKINSQYATTKEFEWETKGKTFIAQSEKTVIDLTPTQITEATKTIKANIAWNLGRPHTKFGFKVDLLRAIIALPDRFNKNDLVLFFGSHYPTHKAREEGELIKVARKAQCAQSLKQGFATAPLET
ncbi:hypothetical protein F5Y16DRAFT_402162 [Xylariaceae sp. FL0255]|nr:hypothetical protein F5Y16DRAFT_402162 [Xylariaceae sp. FL0255]